MITIASVGVDHYRIPLPVVLSDSTHGDIAAFELVTVRLRDAAGVEGLGYTYTVGQGGAAIAVLVERDLRPVLLGAEADRIEALWQRLWWRLHYGGRGGFACLAIAAVDIALWDMRARRFATPLWRLLGGHDPRVPAGACPRAARSAGPGAGGIDLDFPLDRLLRQTDENREKGFRAIKMKVGRPRLSDDLERVRAMREHLGADFPLMVDANMRWSVDEAVRAARGLAEFGVYWLEEPTIPDDVAGHRRIVRDGGLPVATGENLHTLYEFKEMIAAGGVSFPEADVTNCGGVTVFLKIAHLAEAFNLPITSHGAHDVTVQLLAALPNRSYLEVHGFGLERFLLHPFELADGMATAPERPGHGVEFDWRGLDRVRAP